MQAEVDVAKRREDALAVYLGKRFTQLPLQNISTKAIASFKPDSDNPFDDLDNPNKTFLPELEPLFGQNLADYCKQLSQMVGEKLEEIERATHEPNATPESPTGTGLSLTATCNLL